MKTLLFFMLILAGCSSAPKTKTVVITPFEGKLQWNKPDMVILRSDGWPTIHCGVFNLDGTPVHESDTFQPGSTFLVNCK